MGLLVVMAIGLLILTGAVWAVMNIAQSRESNGKKLFWIVLVLFLPPIGIPIWFVMGPRGQ